MTHPDSGASPCPSPSALRVAAARALHRLLDAPLVLDDAHALPMLGPQAAASLLADPLAHNDVAARSLRAGIVARTRHAEDRLLRAVASGTRQYALLGAGLDTWAWRAHHTLPAVHAFELDQPAMQAWKRQVCADNGWTAPAHLHWASCDLTRDDPIAVLRRAGARLEQPLSVSLLGVLVYLDEACVSRILDALGGLAPGSTLVLDYRLDDALLPPMERFMMQAVAQGMAAGGEPWLSSCSPQRLQQLLARAGFEVEEDIDASDLNRRYFHQRRDGLQIAGGGFRHASAIKKG